MDITSVFKGLTTPTNQLHSQIHKSGWEVTKIGWDKKLNHFVAEAKSPHGETISKSGPDDKSALANLLIAVSRHNHIRTPVQAKIGILKTSAWENPPTNALQEIAKEYAEAPVYEPQAAIYFHELGQDSNRRAEVIRQQLKVSVVDDPEPYHSVHEMVKDIHKKKNFLVSRAHSEHPVWDTQTVVDFRIVHDVMGYAVSGGNFNYEGEVNASAAHAPLLSPTAQVALVVEGIYQTAYASHYRSLGPQKVFVPKLLNPLNGGNGEAPHAGIHPSQMSVPTALPEMQHEPSATSVSELGLTTSAANNTLDPNKGWKSGISPLNQEQHGVGNAYLDHDDPLDAQASMDMARKIDTDWSNLIDGNGEPDYNRMKQAIVNAFRVVLLSPRKDLSANALHYQDIATVPHSTTDPKVYWDTLEHCRKTHNQAQGIDPNAHMVYYKFLKPFTNVIHQMHPELNYKEREAKAKQTLFNWWTEEQQRIETQDADKPVDKQRGADEIERRANESLAKRIQTFLKDKSDTKTDVHHHEPISLFGKKNYKQHLHDRFDHVGFDNPGLKAVAKNIQERLGPEVPDDYVDEMMSLYAYLALTSGAQTTNEEVHDAWSYWMLVYQKDPDHKSLIPFDELDEATQDMDTEYRDAIRNAAKDEKISSWRHIAAPQYNLLTGEEANKYPAWMGTHLKAIAQISQHVDDIFQAALTDIKEHDGAGHHFRAQVLQLKVSGVGPKVCSFAWLLLQPMTSQLATVDTHIMDVLGHNYEKEMNSRSYFKFERELAAGRDASGYSHMPLGVYQWATWDAKRTGPGTHQDHSAMKVLDPLPHKHIDWAKKQDPIGKGSEQYKADWAKNAPDWWQNTKPAREQVADDWDKNVAPNFAQNEVPYQVTARLASSEKDDEFHIGISLPEEVIERIARWTAFADLPDDIKLDDPSEYHMTVLWTEEGFDDEDRHSWVSQNDIHGIAFENARVHQFPARSDKGSAVVLRFDSPEGKKLTNRLMSEAKERGYEFKRFDGGWKPHITIGWTHEKVISQKLDWGFRSDGLYVSAPRSLREDGDWFDRKLADNKKDKGDDEKKFSEGFGHWWQAEKPHGKHNATKMAEYAVGTKTSRSKAIDYVEDHKEDVKGDYMEFKKAFIKKFDSMDKISKTASHTPWFTHQDQDHQGEPGGTIMQHAVNTLGLSTPDIWKVIGENAGKNTIK